jgi:hypothetical protein
MVAEGHGPYYSVVVYVPPPKNKNKNRNENENEVVCLESDEPKHIERPIRT